jgi:hypothetical protein
MEDPLVALALNLSRFHREQEKYYSATPLEDAAGLQRTSLALTALAERWSRVEAGGRSAASPFAGAEDLNDERANELAGILFMEGEGEPAEISRAKRDLRTAAASHEGSPRPPPRWRNRAHRAHEPRGGRADAARR